MLRETCAVLGAVLLFAPGQPPHVDAVTFAQAFRAGNAEQYKNKQVSGTGVSFHGAIKERIGDGSTRTSLVMTLGTAAADGKLTLLKTWDEFVAAEKAKSTLVVALSGPNLPEPPATGPTTYQFSGVYDGQVRTIMRAPQAGPSTATESSPCPNEKPVTDAPAGSSFYCAPLLTGATASASVPGKQ
jgi:hypothetical protein